ncbi:MAG: hypothetical protein WA213_20720 [Terriglobales bacterium]
MATPAVTQWDAQGNPIQSAPAVREWDANGKPISAAPPAEMNAIPKWSDPGGVAYHLRALRNKAVNMLPQAGGLVGGIIGAGSGAETGPGAIATGSAGAAAGGAGGEAARQMIFHALYPKMKDMSPAQSAEKIGEQAVVQGLTEAVGQVGGRFVGKLVRPAGKLVPDAVFAKYPFLKSVFAVGDEASPRAAQHLTAAASTKATAGPTLEAVNTSLGDLEQEMTKLPANQRTVEGFLGAVKTRKDAMNLESGAAMLPIAGKQTVPTGIADSIRNLVRPWMDQTAQGRAQKAAILRAAKDYDKPWTYSELDTLRTDLSSQLAKHKAKGAVAKYTAEKGDTDLAIDNAVLDGLRSTVYPEMDQAAGKPAGYFEDLKGRQSALITLQQTLDKRIEDLAGQQALSEVAPRFSSENLSGSLHAGSMPRLGVYGIRQALAPTRELEAASKHVLKAFPDVNALPYQVLFSTALRAPEAENSAKTAPPPQGVAAALSANQ